MITQEEYMNPKKFPLTSQGDLDFSDQMLIDSFNYDQLVYYVQIGNELSESQKGRVKELETKLNRNFKEDLKKAKLQ